MTLAPIQSTCYFTFKIASNWNWGKCHDKILQDLGLRRYKKYNYKKNCI